MSFQHPNVRCDKPTEKVAVREKHRAATGLQRPPHNARATGAGRAPLLTSGPCPPPSAFLLFRAACRPPASSPAPAGLLYPFTQTAFAMA